MPSTASPSGTDLSPSDLSRGNPPAGAASVSDGFRALTATAGVFDMNSRAKILLTGADRVRWLNGMVTNNIRDLAVGHGVYAFLLNPQGHILGDLYAYNRGEFLLVDTEASQAEEIMSIFDHYIIMDDVEVANGSDKLAAVGIAGPQSVDVLQAAGFDVPELEPLQVLDRVWQDAGVTLVRGEGEHILSYEIWLAPPNLGPLRDTLGKAGAVTVSLETLELYRIARGIPRYGPDIRGRDLPQETEQQRALHFNKGCYVGQEIVERIRSRGGVHRKFTGFEIAGSVPPPGARIQAQGREIGEVTSATSLPLPEGERTVALGYIQRQWGDPGRTVEIGGVRATVSDLPFSGVFRK
ncbi:MAG TPA: glycine cleavage T C-terminal barrel domain-containing protein [Terriglobales bacterium]|nr:glycine cleavage T C-terminal barrel domain-containing protein [Terriglobales bacterium]